MTPAGLLDVCADHDLTGLVHQRLHTRHPDPDWPDDVRERLAQAARAEAAKELLRSREITAVLQTLAAEGIRPILFKGTALAYQIYAAPHLRPRCDTDLLVPRAQIEAVRRTLAPLGYGAALLCDGELLFCQFELTRKDEFGVDHAFDLHWKISTQSLFADLLTYDEVAAHAVPVPALGSDARAARPLHALLLACIHPVMHHRNTERLLWIHDIHLLASQLSAAEFDRFVELAVAKQVSAIGAHGLARARARFGTTIPDEVMAKLSTARAAEPSATYLQAARRWHDELASSVQGLPRWADRVRLLREVIFPSPAYMFRAYGVSPGPLSATLLPALYFRRGMSGLGKVLTRRK